MNCGNLYGVYDRKAGYFVNVFVSSNDDTAKRSFENLFFTVEDTVFNLCKNDFTLAKLCELSSIPGCTGDAVLVKPLPIMLAADIPDYLIRETRKQLHKFYEGEGSQESLRKHLTHRRIQIYFGESAVRKRERYNWGKIIKRSNYG